MEDEIKEALCSMLQRLSNTVYDDNIYNTTSDDIKSFTVDGIPIRKLFIGNIAQRTTHKDLEKLFSAYGKLDSCFLKRNAGKTNYAFVTFNSMNDAFQATRDGFKKKIHLHNRDLRVSPADSWHQPDSIENQNKKVQKTSEFKNESAEFIVNDDAEIHKLNNDCLVHIFTFLPIADRVKMERVCRRWRVISHESWHTFKRIDLTPSTWGFRVSNTGIREINTPTLRKVLLLCGQFLTHIDFSTYVETLGTSTMTIVSRLCPNLQYIDVTGLNVSPAGIKALTANYSNITEFNLGHCSSACDNDLSHLFLKNKKLRNLKLVQNLLSGKCLLNLPAESIEKITLSECNNISPCHFYSAIQTFHKLHTLSIEKCVSFNDQAAKGISLCSKSLKVLHFSHYYPMLRPYAMRNIAELVNLESLNVSHNIVVNDEFLVLLGAQCKQLVNVDISACNDVTNDGLAAITSLPKLQHLSISYLGKITGKELTDMPNLRTLHCRGTPNVSNLGLCTLVEESPNLELLDISGCHLVTNELIEVAIRATKTRTNNTVLKIYVGGTDVNVAEITKVSPYLQVLNVDLSEPYLRPDYNHDDYFPHEFDDFDIAMDEQDVPELIYIIDELSF